jgi:hypothetical protein
MIKELKPETHESHSGYAQSFNKTANAGLRDALHILYQGVLCFENATRFSMNTPKCSFMYGHKKTTALPAPIFTTAHKSSISRSRVGESH